MDFVFVGRRQSHCHRMCLDHAAAGERGAGGHAAFLGARLPNILADERSLRQIVLNLLSNAVKFNQPGGRVIVSTALADGGRRSSAFAIPGLACPRTISMSPSSPSGGSPPQDHRGGTGLGLPLTKALVEANHAAFSIKSRARGHFGRGRFPAGARSSPSTGSRQTTIPTGNELPPAPVPFGRRGTTMIAKAKPKTDQAGTRKAPATARRTCR